MTVFVESLTLDGATSIVPIFVTIVCVIRLTGGEGLHPVTSFSFVIASITNISTLKYERTSILADMV